MNNLECVIEVLARHREARQWNDEAVAQELLQGLGLNPTDRVRVTEAEVAAAETEAAAAAEKAKELRAAFVAQGVVVPVEAEPDHAAAQLEAAAANATAGDRSQIAGAG